MIDERSLKATYFAPPGRATDEELANLVEAARNDPLITLVLESVDSYLLVLNEQRQVLAVNPMVSDQQALQDDTCLLGLRPGELFECVHLAEGPDGCGTAPHCATCGAALSILGSQQEAQPVSGECRMTAVRDGQRMAFDFGVRATPMQVGEHKLTVFVLRDISDQKRREALERVFFHDVLNTVGGIRGWTKKLMSDDAQDTANQLVSLVDRLVGDIGHQRAIFDAENTTLEAITHHVKVDRLLAEVEALFRGQQHSPDCDIQVDRAGELASVVTDPVLLGRVLNNMVKNAIEATPAGGCVHVWFELTDDCPGFFVHNPGSIPEEIARHVFERSFSTKNEPGRGLGTYSMKLLGERYLGGAVSFTTSVEEGTTFSIMLPTEAAGDELFPHHSTDEISVWVAESAALAARAAAIPTPLQEQLCEAAGGGYVDRLQALVVEVTPFDAELAAALREMIDRYDYEALIAVVAPEKR